MWWDALGDPHVFCAVTETTFNGVKPCERDSHGQIGAIWEEPGFCPSQILALTEIWTANMGHPSEQDSKKLTIKSSITADPVMIPLSVLAEG